MPFLSNFHHSSDAYCVSQTVRRCVYCRGAIEKGETYCTIGGSDGSLLNARGHTYCVAIVRNAERPVTPANFDRYLAGMWQLELGPILEVLSTTEEVRKGYEVYHMVMNEALEELLHEDLREKNKNKFKLPKRMTFDLSALEED